jgi:hypothetical protein
MLELSARAPTFHRQLFDSVIQEFGDWSGSSDSPEPSVEVNDRSMPISMASRLCDCDVPVPRSFIRRLRSMGVLVAEGDRYREVGRQLRWAVRSIQLEV